MSQRLTTFFTVLLFMVVTVNNARAAQAPTLPHHLYGSVRIDGALPGPGTPLTAWVNGAQVAQTSVFYVAGDSVYALDIPGDDPTTPALEGAPAGATVTFRIGDVAAAQTIVWAYGEATRLNLTTSSLPPAPPVAADQSISTAEDVASAITLAASDANFDPLTFSIVSAPANGVLSGSAPQLLYTPNPNFFGSDSFTFVANDGQADSNTATVTIAVTPVNDAPAIVPIGDQALNEGDVLTIGVAASDVEGDAVTLSAAALPAFAAFVDNGDGTGMLTLAPGYDDAGSYNITVSASDGAASSTQDFAVTVSDAAPKPIARFSADDDWNVALDDNGATVAATSGSYSGVNTAKAAIDSSDTSEWRSPYTKVTNQWFTIALAAGQSQIIDRVVIKGAYNGSAMGVKSFEVRVANGSDPNGPFETVVAGVVPQDAALHEFTFAPVEARYVQLYAFDNWGHNDAIAVSVFQVWTRVRNGGLVSLLEGLPATATSSSEYGTNFNPPRHAIDASTSTFWRSNPNQAMPQWLTVDLAGRVHTINRVRLQASVATRAANQFEVRVSTSGEEGSFNTVFSGNGTADAGVQEFTFPPVDARFVQIYVLSVHGGDSAQINTLEVLAPDGGSVARGAGVGAEVLAASSVAGSSTYRPDNAIDYSTNTYWSTVSGQTTNQWIKVRLLDGKRYVINRIQLQGGSTNTSGPKDFDIRVADEIDGNFVTIFSGQMPADTRAHEFAFAPVAAKYVQLYIKTAYSGSTLQVKNLRIFAADEGGATVPFRDFSTDPVGQVVNWNWDFGDGATSAEKDPIHTYGAPGVYTVTLTVTSDSGQSATSTMLYNVLNAPAVDFTWSPMPATEGTTNNFYDASSSQEGALVAWRWQFADNQDRYTQNTTNVHFADNGDYPATLTVLDSRFMEGTLSQTVTAINVAPVLNVGGNRAVPWGVTWRPEGTLQDASPIDDASLVCVWDYKNGEVVQVENCTSSGWEVNHQYMLPGFYQPTITATDKDGGAVTRSIDVTVRKRRALVNAYVRAVDRNAGLITLGAHLWDIDNGWAGAAEKPLLFTVNDQSATATTNASGYTTVTLPYSGDLLNITAHFAADDFYLGDDMTTAVNVANPLPKGDVVFLFDESGSMGDEQADVKDRLNEITAQMGAQLDFRIGLLGYGADILNGGVPDPYTGDLATHDSSARLLTKLTNDPVEFSAGMDQLNALGGAENGFHATVHGLNDDMGFRPDAGVCLVLITDEEATGNITTWLPETKADALAALATRNAVFFGIVDPNFGRTPNDYGPNPGSLAAESGGQVWPIQDFRTDASAVLNALVAQCIARVIEQTTPDLVVSKADGGVIAERGRPLTYTITVSNTGVGVASAVVISDGLPAQTTFLSASDGGALLDGIVTWPAFALNAGEAATRTLTVQVNETLLPGATTITNTASAHDQAAADGNPADNSATVVTAVNSNDAPVAVDDSFVVDEDSVDNDLSVSANDSDPDGDAISLAAVGQPSAGSVSADGNAVRFTPPADFNGSAVFTYTISDGSLSSTATVTVTVTPVNDAPFAMNDAATTPENEAVAVAVLANDTDIDGDALVIAALEQPLNGAAAISGTLVVYTPAPGFNGDDAFSYTASDGALTSSATVLVTVTPVNDPPVAVDDEVTTDEDAPILIDALANDSDPDGDGLTIVETGAPQHGTVVIDNGSALLYTPSADFHGEDSFPYTVSDGNGATATANVKVIVNPVNDAPAAVDDAGTTAEETPLVIAVLANDDDVDGDGLLLEAVTQPLHGAAVVQGSDVLYTPAVDFFGDDSFTYAVTDGLGGSASASVTVSVTPANDAPQAGDDEITTDEDVPVVVNVLVNDADVDGDELSIVAVAQPLSGTVTISGTVIVYTPTLDFNGSEVFTYTVGDGALDATAAVTVTVNPVNDAPLAIDDEVATVANSAINVAVLDNDWDVEGDVLTVVSIGQPANGAAVANGDNTVTYTPGSGFVGMDSFTYTIEDGQGGSAVAVVLVTVEEPPAIVCDLYPVALHETTLAGANPGDALTDIFNGEQPGNFGWLTWSGNPNTPTLVDNLTPPGNGDTYVNPNDEGDHVVSIGDWVQGKPGVSNAREVRAALDALLGVDIIVPVWDAAEGAGANANYHVADFAQVRLLAYDLAGQNHISAQFVDLVTCVDEGVQASALESLPAAARNKAGPILYLPLVHSAGAEPPVEAAAFTARLYLPLVTQ